MKLTDRLRQLEQEEVAAEKRANDKKLREQEQRRLLQDKEDQEYIDSQLEPFLGTLSQVIISKRKEGKLVVDTRQRWLYQSPCETFRYGLFLDKALEKIREWAINEGFRVITEPHVEIDRDYDRDHEGGAIDGTDRPVYGPRITLHWEVQ